MVTMVWSSHTAMPTLRKSPLTERASKHLVPWYVITVWTVWQKSKVSCSHMWVSFTCLHTTEQLTFSMSKSCICSTLVPDISWLTIISQMHIRQIQTTECLNNSFYLSVQHSQYVINNPMKGIVKISQYTWNYQIQSCEGTNMEWWVLIVAVGIVTCGGSKWSSTAHTMNFF